ncbi:MAG TPA: glutamine cyclotransferase [Pseudohongiella sp.]|nr:glutamine cyclotransferase [Pseudohongiella sp.]
MLFPRLHLSHSLAERRQRPCISFSITGSLLYGAAGKNLLCLLLIGLALSIAVPARAQVPVYDFEVVAQYPHNSRFFTQGLLVHDGRLYEGTGRYGESALMEINLADGSVVRRVDLAQRYFGEGIAVAGDRLFQLTWRENVAFEYDLDTFERVNAHFIPMEGWGLTWDGESLILSDGSHQLYFLDPDTFATRRRVAVQAGGQYIGNLNELEFIDGEVWANVWMSQQIVRINPETGDITGVIDLTGLADRTERGPGDSVLNGIAWDAEQRRLLVTGKLWSHVFEISLHPRSDLASQD